MIGEAPLASRCPSPDTEYAPAPRTDCPLEPSLEENDHEKHCWRTAWRSHAGWHGGLGQRSRLQGHRLGRRRTRYPADLELSRPESVTHQLPSAHEAAAAGPRGLDEAHEASID